MTLFDYLELLGGLSMLLFGMPILGDGWNVVSGGKMESLLERLQLRVEYCNIYMDIRRSFPFFCRAFIGST